MDQKMIAGDRFEKPLGVKKKKRSPMLVESGENLYKMEEEKKKNKYSGQKRRKREKGNKVDACKMDQFNIKDKSIEAGGEKKKGKSLREKKRKNEKKNKAVIAKVDELDHKVEDDDGMVGPRQSESQEKIENSKGPKEADSGKDFRTRKSRKASKNKKTDHLSSKKDKQLLKKRGEAEPDVVYQISSGDEDCSKGMKKWITEYHQSRPGLKILQQRIDDFITTHEAQEEQARKEREALAAEGGWTVVVHHKGRKKTTDSESGITVGSVAQVAVLDKMAKKKSKDYGLDFYRFQRREAQRNEIMMLRSKFEQDRKRIQELRAARKFRPY